PLPSTSHTREPFVLLTKNGSPPTLRKARTGEFTPPGIYSSASAKSFRDSLLATVFITLPCTLSPFTPSHFFLKNVSCNDPRSVRITVPTPMLFFLNQPCGVSSTN